MQEATTISIGQVKSVQFRLDYIHAERLPVPHNPTQPVNIMFNLNVLTSNVAQHDTTLEIPFVVNISSMPSIISVTLRGAVIIQFENANEVSQIMKMLNEGKVPELINLVIMQYVIFEVSLIVRELGLPPMIPIPQLTSQKQEKTTELHYV